MPYLGTTPASSAAATSDLGDNIVTLAKLAGGTDGNVISFDASGDPVAIATGDDGEVLTSAGAGAPPAFEAAGGGGFTLGTELATTSGTSKTFGSIPAGTTMIVIMFEEVSFNSTNLMDVTIGDAGGLETSGYESGGHKILTTSISSSGQTLDAFIMNKTQSGDILNGTMTLSLKDSSGFTWAEHHVMHADGANILWGSGTKSLSAELTQVSISGGTFNNGSINIMYQ